MIPATRSTTSLNLRIAFSIMAIGRRLCWIPQLYGEFRQLRTRCYPLEVDFQVVLDSRGTTLLCYVTFGRGTEMMKGLALALGGTLCLVGCTQVSRYTPLSRFDPSTARWSNERGSDTIKGEGFMRTVGGDIKTCAGFPVSLAPADPYFAEIGLALSEGKTIVNRDTVAERFVRRTRCDAAGKFKFTNLPAGQWFVGTDVYWGVPSGGTIVRQGSFLSKSVATGGSPVTDVILTR